MPPKKESTDGLGHFIRTEIDSTDFKKENLVSKVRKNKTRKLYISTTKIEDVPKDSETADTIKTLEDIATFEPGKNAQLAAKKISKKYKKIKRGTR